jgi:stage II sporulation protein D
MAELKAQAIISRSFALTGTVEGDGYDLYSDTRSQVYKGLESEYTTSDEAAEGTKGQVLMYGGEVAETLFTACSGGETESIANVFGAAIPYLVGVPDPYDNLCPLHDWTLRFSGPEISAKLSGLLDGRLKKIVITKTGYSPRIIEAKLYGTSGVTTATGEQLQIALGGYSTWMTFQKVVTK